MQDSSADGLLGELNDKHRRLRLAPWICTAAIAGVALAVAKYSNQTGFLAAVVGAITIVTSLIADALRKTTVILYDLDEDASASFKALVEALQQIGQAQRLWHIASSADVLNRKYHAGAGSQIKRAVTQVSVGEVPLVKCNLEVPALTVGRQTLYFMPERLLVRDFEGFGAIPYAILDVAREPIRFIETEGVPSDSRVVDGTWHFVNKNGGPDRRFRDNRQIPICEYESIHFRSRSGLNELLYASKVGVAEALTRYLAIEGPSLSRST